MGRRSTMLALLACAMALAACSESVQQPVDFGGVYLELLLAHISLIRDEVRQELQEYRQLTATIQADVRRILEQMPGRLRKHSTEAVDGASVLQSKATDGYRTMEGEVVNFRTTTVSFSQSNPKLHGEWIVIQHRYDGSEDFFRDWAAYRDGFGALEREHWLGLAKVHGILATERHELLVLLVDLDGKTAYAHYDHFELGDERENYALKTLGQYAGTAGNALENHRGQPFSTSDREISVINCAKKFHGAWWFKHCYSCHLNGVYLKERMQRQGGVIWTPFGGPFNSLKNTTMLIRRYVH